MEEMLTEDKWWKKLFSSQLCLKRTETYFCFCRKVSVETKDMEVRAHTVECGLRETP